MTRGTIRMPRSPAARLRAEMRRSGVKATARAWGITMLDALKITSSLPARRSAVVAVLERVAREAKGGSR